MFDLQIKLQ